MKQPDTVTGGRAVVHRQGTPRHRDGDAAEPDQIGGGELVGQRRLGDVQLVALDVHGSAVAVPRVGFRQRRWPRIAVPRAQPRPHRAQ